MAQRVDGVYYEHPLPLSNGYPYYQQIEAEYPGGSGSTNFVEIRFQDGSWNIIDVIEGIQLREDSGNTQYVPPHDIGGGAWTDVQDDELTVYTVFISCGNITVSPTSNPTGIPTVSPTEPPSTEPTIEPIVGMIVM